MRDHPFKAHGYHGYCQLLSQASDVVAAFLLHTLLGNIFQ